MNKVNLLLELAIEASHLGGAILKNYFGKVDSSTIKSKSSGDWVSEADHASESAIIKFLAEKMPDHAVLTEEAGIIQTSKNSEYRWIIDPLDGTTNFLRGLPIWAVSVALERRFDPNEKWGRIVIGAIHIPMLNETFWASIGQGSYRNGEPINVGRAKSFQESLLATGFPFRARELAGRYLELFGDILPRCTDIRRAGAAAVDLCYTAAGIFDGFWELDLSPWDIAAGSLIISEAGGSVGNFQGGNDFMTTGDIVAGHPAIYDQLVGIVRKHFPTPRTIDKAPTIF